MLLSDIDGLYTANPKEDPTASLIPVVEDVDAVMSLGGGSSSIFGKGGMATKLHAAQTAAPRGWIWQSSTAPIPPFSTVCLTVRTSVHTL